MNADARPLSDAELIALAALAQVEALSMTAENAQRASMGAAPAYNGCYSEASTKLDAELRRRGAL